MRVAIAGKGGTGKTTISGILCRALARRGRSVLAVDADSNPNLASILGFDGGESGVPALSRSLLERVEDPDGTRRLVLTRPLDAVLEEHAALGPDGVRLVVMERVGHGGAG
ncbi:MAG: AAA family ATPase [Gemmatimonadetes bacterium]|nr:AAA family ATPase [Gemmatimonadota bacterium]